MKITLNILGVLLVLFGAIILQGINVLPGSFMSGQRQWAIRGRIARLRWESSPLPGGCQKAPLTA